MRERLEKPLGKFAEWRSNTHEALYNWLLAKYGFHEFWIPGDPRPEVEKTVGPEATEEVHVDQRPSSKEV